MFQPCTESLFVTIFHNLDVISVVRPVLLAMLQSNHGPVSESDLNGILLKDAVYNAIGLAGYGLYDEVCCLSELLLYINKFACCA